MYVKSLQLFSQKSARKIRTCLGALKRNKGDLQGEDEGESEGEGKGVGEEEK